MGKWLSGAIGLVVIVIGAALLYRQQTTPPGCADLATINLARAKLSSQFHFPDAIKLVNVRTSVGGLFARRLECEADIQNDMLQVGPEPVRYSSQLTEDSHQQYVDAAPAFSPPALLPVVSCDADGQVGFVSGPKEVKSVPSVADWARRYLAYYATNSIGVVAPRGWSCFSTYGSSGDNLFVASHPLNSDDFFKSDKPLSGPAVQSSFSFADTSGRFSVARTIARLFPNEQDFVKRVIAEKLEPASDFPIGPYPVDRLVRRNEFVVEFETPPNSEGMGTHSLLAKDSLPIDGAAMLLKGGALILTVKLPAELKSLGPEIIRAVEWQNRDNLELEGDGP
jgi:hypothetical protein